MLDLKFIRENPDKVREGIRKKNANIDIDALLLLDAEHRSILRSLEEFRAKQNKMSMGMKGGSDELKDLKEHVQGLAASENKKRAEFEAALLLVPNIPFEGVPVGKDASANVVLREVGEKPKFDFVPKDYLSLAGKHDIIDIDRAAKVSGTRFGYLKGAAALMEFALVQYTFAVLTDEAMLSQIIKNTLSAAGVAPRAFLPVVPPAMIKPEVFRKMARLDAGQEEERYYIAKDDLYLAGSAEHTLGPLHMGETLHQDELPRRYVGFSTSFRREAGSYGKDTKGILRVHQFDKLEMESFCSPKSSDKEFEFIVACQEYLLRGLGIPYRVVEICTGDMGGPDARQIDLEAWMPGQGVYRETHTADHMTDYQSRRLETKVRGVDGGKMEFVHMIDATAFAIGRTLVAIIENYQEADGSIRVPDALHPYLPFKKIG